MRHLPATRKPVHSIILVKLDCLFVRESGIILSKWLLKTSNLFWVYWRMGVWAETIYRSYYRGKCCMMYTHSFWVQSRKPNEGKKFSVLWIGISKPCETTCISKCSHLYTIQQVQHLCICQLPPDSNTNGTQTVLLYVNSNLNGIRFASNCYQYHYTSLFCVHIIMT